MPNIGDKAMSQMKSIAAPPKIAKILMVIGGINWFFVALKMRKEPESPNDLLQMLAGSKYTSKVPRVTGLVTVQQTVYYAVGISTCYILYLKYKEHKMMMHR